MQLRGLTFDIVCSLRCLEHRLELTVQLRKACARLFRLPFQLLLCQLPIVLARSIRLGSQGSDLCREFLSLFSRLAKQRFDLVSRSEAQLVDFETKRSRFCI